MSELAATLVLGVIVVAAIYLLDIVATRAEVTGRESLARRLTLGVLGGLTGVLLLVGPANAALNLGRGGEPGSGNWLLMALGVSGGVVLWPVTRRLLARFLPFNSESLRDVLGLLAIVWVVVLQVGLYLAGSVEIADGGIPVSALFAQAAVFVGVAFAAVGLFTRRTPRQAAERLGLRKPTIRTILAGIVLVIPILVAAALSLVIVEAIQPGTGDELADTLDRLTGEDPGFGTALAIALTASTGEELLFRGAIQPRYGLVFTAVVFGLLHVQYDVLLNLLSLVPAGIILGLERRYLGTTACIVTHGVYNLLAVLSS